MFVAALFPGTAVNDPEFADRTASVLGLHAQLFLALVLVALLGAACGLVLRDRSPR
ncbi:hypothetical protein JOF41_004358 [Saccharothrix coeruleofusca]|uniref:hypothetical protein n=1 Tax=Saccharothrix coeruleofusca TaxID=33919 RepID=UPI001AE9C0B7|nr:hypothetical protein [Saccharothrix coeruleofusca]MBP2338180.1 hypothetical protein [Saccharothrix coeruleofusca]